MHTSGAYGFNPHSSELPFSNGKQPTVVLPSYMGMNGVGMLDLARVVSHEDLAFPEGYSVMQEPDQSHGRVARKKHNRSKSATSEKSLKPRKRKKRCRRRHHQGDHSGHK